MNRLKINQCQIPGPEYRQFAVGCRPMCIVFQNSALDSWQINSIADEIYQLPAQVDSQKKNNVGISSKKIK